jgi:phosphatidylinositol kinase/protein kinase (PI-3  family)
MRSVKQIFDKASCNLFLRPYDIFITSNSSGLVEYIADSLSLDVIKNKYSKGKQSSLRDFFDLAFSDDFEEC